MDKSPDAFRTISEVADVLDTPAHVLRFWETRFPQIKPVKRAGGRRYYRPSDVALLTGIKRLLHDDGLTIRGVQKILREQGVRHVSALGGGGGAHLSMQDEPVDIIDDTGTHDDEVTTFAAAEASASPIADLWPDADLSPPDDNGALVLHLQVPDRNAAAERPLIEDALPEPAARSDQQSPRDVFDTAAAGDAVAVPDDLDDRLIAAVLQTDPEPQSAPEPTPAAPPRVNDGWRSLPLAAGEEMPMAARLRALPRGALIARSTEVAAWTLRARSLADRMRRAGPGGQGGSPSH